MKVKTRTKDSDWREALRDIEEIVPEEHIKALAESALEAVKSTINGNSVISYSAGKDSIVLEHVLRPLGLPSLMAYSDFEYPAFMEWVKANAPDNLIMVNSGQSLQWLADHEDMLFPDNSKKAGRWYDIVQHKVQNRFIKDNHVDYLILGRRLSDGNYCGQEGIYKKGNCNVLSPLYKWRHEDILAYIHYNNLPLPPIYDWPDGYKQGTHNWASFILYDGMTKEQALERLWNIDKSIILKAKDYIPTIKRWYDENGKGSN